MPLKDTQITIRDLSFSVEGKALLQNTSLSLSGEGITVLLGANGAGKTIFLKLLAGLLTPCSGTITSNKKTLAIKTCSFVSQEPVILRRTVLKNMLFVLQRITPEESTLAKELLRMMGLNNKEHQNALTLSAGERQRLCLARAIITNPEILLLDEPTANIEPNSTTLIEKYLIQKVRSFRKIFFVTHDINQARRLADEIVFIDTGRVIEHSSSENFFKNPKTKEARKYISGKIN
jgi:tungstate transport system ATP-binding protein